MSVDSLNVMVWGPFSLVPMLLVGTGKEEPGTLRSCMRCIWTTCIGVGVDK